MRVRACARVWSLEMFSLLTAVTAAAAAACISFSFVCAQGFDEYMNLTLDEAEEHDVANDTRTKIGRILLKGDNVSLMQAV